MATYQTTYSAGMSRMVMPDPAPSEASPAPSEAPATPSEATPDPAVPSLLRLALALPTPGP